MQTITNEPITQGNRNVVIKRDMLGRITKVSGRSVRYLYLGGPTFIHVVKYDAENNEITYLATGDQEKTEWFLIFPITHVYRDYISRDREGIYYVERQYRGESGKRRWQLEKAPEIDRKTGELKYIRKEFGSEHYDGENIIRRDCTVDPAKGMERDLEDSQYWLCGILEAIVFTILFFPAIVVSSICTAIQAIRDRMDQ